VKSLIEHTDVHYIKWLTSQKKLDAIRELAEVFTGSEPCPDVDGLIAALTEREEIMSTGIGFGIAIPHARISSVKEMVFAIGISKEGIEFDSFDGSPVRLVILVAAGVQQHREYLKLLSRIMTVIKQGDNKDRIMNASSPEEIINIFKAQKSI
jgi:mannitol/fructose-specific phosphotransferase system IIA component (Ntr-type)